MGQSADNAIRSLAWSGLLECARDSITAMRQHHEYVRSDAYRAKVDMLDLCLGEFESRLGAQVCLPAPGEPSFTLLGRDPQAPAIVEAWAEGRALAEPEDKEKVAEARAKAEEMRRWRATAPRPPRLSRLREAMRASPGLSQRRDQGPA